MKFLQSNSFILWVKHTVVPRLLENYWNVKLLWTLGVCEIYVSKKRRQNSAKLRRNKEWKTIIRIPVLAILNHWFFFNLITSSEHENQLQGCMTQFVTQHQHQVTRYLWFPDDVAWMVNARTIHCCVILSTIPLSSTRKYVNRDAKETAK